VRDVVREVGGGGVVLHLVEEGEERAAKIRG